MTSLFTQNAIEFIKSNLSNPFFLYLAHPMPHVPLAASEQFTGMSGEGLYGDVIIEIDWSVGQIIKVLEENNLRKNTIILFISDNGPWLNFGNHAGSAGGLREGKLTSFEGGVRVPCIINWPKVIKEGRVVNDLATTMEILPTIAEITDGTLSENQIDGISIFSLLKGEEPEKVRSELYYYNGFRLEAVRKNNWKLILPHIHLSYEEVQQGNNGIPGSYNQKKSGARLYNLRTDPGERYDLYDSYPEIVVELELIAKNAREDLGDELLGIEGKNLRKPGILKR